jgi:hypothetical protein
MPAAVAVSPVPAIGTPGLGTVEAGAAGAAGAAGLGAAMGMPGLESEPAAAGLGLGLVLGLGVGRLGGGADRGVETRAGAGDGAGEGDAEGSGGVEAGTEVGTEEGDEDGAAALVAVVSCLIESEDGVDKAPGAVQAGLGLPLAEGELASAAHECLPMVEATKLLQVEPCAPGVSAAKSDCAREAGEMRVGVSSRSCCEEDEETVGERWGVRDAREEGS